MPWKVMERRLRCSLAKAPPSTHTCSYPLTSSVLAPAGSSRCETFSECVPMLCGKEKGSSFGSGAVPPLRPGPGRPSAEGGSYLGVRVEAGDLGVVPVAQAEGTQVVSIRLGWDEIFAVDHSLVLGAGRSCWGRRV